MHNFLFELRTNIGDKRNQFFRSRTGTGGPAAGVHVGVWHNEAGKGADQTGGLLLSPSTDDHVRLTGAGRRTSSQTFQVSMHFDTLSVVGGLQHIRKSVDQTHADVRPRHNNAAPSTMLSTPANARLLTLVYAVCINNDVTTNHRQSRISTGAGDGGAGARTEQAVVDGLCCTDLTGHM